jgi:hypothetical protein
LDITRKLAIASQHNNDLAVYARLIEMHLYHACPSPPSTPPSLYCVDLDPAYYLTLEEVKRRMSDASLALHSITVNGIFKMVCGGRGECGCGW